MLETLYAKIGAGIAVFLFIFILGISSANVYQHHFNFIVGFPNTHFLGMTLGAKFQGLGPQLEEAKAAITNPVTGNTFKDDYKIETLMYDVVRVNEGKLNMALLEAKNSINELNKQGAAKMAASDAFAQSGNKAITAATHNRDVINAASGKGADFCSRIEATDKAFVGTL